MFERFLVVLGGRTRLEMGVNKRVVKGFVSSYLKKGMV